MRSGNNTFELQSSELTSFLISKSGNSWDEFIEDKASLDDIDIKTIEKFKQLASADRKYISKEADLPTLLERLHLMRDGKITKAGILLFGKEPQSFFPQAYLRMGKFKTETEVKDSVDILGNLFITLETAMGILETKYLMSEYKIGTGSLARSEILEYPRKALREAIINSLIHRDYTGTGHTQLKVLPDRLCLWNEGGLPGGFTIEDLKKPHNSRPRNVLLANIFHEANLVETWGTGTIRMLEACQENGLPEPDFNEEGSGFSVTLYKDMYNEEYLSTLDLTERQILATLYAKEKGSISIAELSQLVSKSPATLKRDLKSLVEKGLLKPVGEKRGRKYIPIR